MLLAKDIRENKTNMTPKEQLELSREMDGDVVETLCDYLEVSTVTGDEPILDQIAKKDKFLSYPYESIKPFLTMLHEAANDDDVVSIKMTLYRVAKQSKVVEALIEAAENGKEVFVLVELKARFFDEENNIGWSRLLGRCGLSCDLWSGWLQSTFQTLPDHEEKDGNVEYYTQIGTGTNNEKTARLYTDLSLMTADPKIGTEAARVFQALAMGETVEDMDHLLVHQNVSRTKYLP